MIPTRLRNLRLSKEHFILIGLFLVMFLAHLFLRRPAFQSDESVYAYSAYAISRGSVPYSGIQLAQPPLVYLALASLFTLVGPNLFFLSLAESVLTLLTNVLVFVTAKRLKLHSSGFLFPLLSVVIYGVITFENFSSSFLEILLTFFIMLCTAIYALFVLNNEQHRSALFLVGVLMGVSLMVKYTSIVFSIGLVLFHWSWLILKRRHKRAVVDGLVLVLGAAIPVVISLAVIAFIWGSFGQFYLQSVYWQTVRWSTPLDLRVFNFLVYALKFFSLLILSGIGILLIYFRTKNFQALFFPIIFVFNFVGLTSVFTTFLLHYLYYLSPFLALLSAFGLAGALGFIRNSPWNFKINKKNLAKFLIFVTIVALTVEVNAQVYFARDFNDDNTHLKVGQYISQITKSNDKIWTSEGAIAFFAERIIVAANSSDWPIHSAFSDIFAYDFNTYKGALMKDYKNGVITPEQFVESWESDKTKAIVIIRGVDWVPYPDELLWSGFNNLSGASGYIQEKYLLNQTFISADGFHVHEVWVRKQE